MFFVIFSLKFWGLREVLRDKYKLVDEEASSLADFLNSLLEVSRTSLDWIGLDWIGLDCIVLYCIVLYCIVLQLLALIALIVRTRLQYTCSSFRMSIMFFLIFQITAFTFSCRSIL